MTKTIKNIFLILKPNEKRQFARLVLFDVIISILDIAFLIALLLLVDLYMKPANKESVLHALGITAQPFRLIGIFCILFAIKNWVAYLVSKAQHYFIYGVASRLSASLLSNYQDGNFIDYVNIDSSVHMRHIHNHPLDFAHYVLRGVQQVLNQIILIVITLIPVLLYKPVLFSLLLVALVPPVFLFAMLMKKRLDIIRETAKTIHEKLIQYLKEAISGFVESNIFQRKDFFRNRYTTFQLEQSKGLSEQQIVQSLPPRIIEVFAVLGLFILIVINFYTEGRSVDLVIIGAFMAAAYKIIPGIVKIMNSVSQVRTYSFTVNDLVNARLETVSEKPASNEVIKTVRFENVSFGFGELQVLNNFSISLVGGKISGLSGMSGKGKTSMVNLLLGFLEPRSGHIFINGKAEAQHERQTHWKKISYVKQQPFLIWDTIFQNISLTENGHDQQRMEAVIRMAGLEELIDGFPEKLNKVITENGKNISGGQRQRIAIARALYKDADLLILDEPFSELDNASTLSILGHLRKLADSGKIILLITHDQQSLDHCDQIISLDEK